MGVAKVLGACSCVLVCWIGFDAWRLSQVKPCVVGATAAVEKLKELPDKYKQKAADDKAEIQDLKDSANAKYTDLKGEAKQAAMSFDWSKAKELKDAASAELSKHKE